LRVEKDGEADVHVWRKVWKYIFRDGLLNLFSDFLLSRMITLKYGGRLPLYRHFIVANCKAIHYGVSGFSKKIFQGVSQQ
jgi:hypothetical protein